jgi:hypothetical protein
MTQDWSKAPGAFDLPPVDGGRKAPAMKEQDGGPRAPMLVWCEECGRFVGVPGAFTGRCPACGASIHVLRCTRCGHKWFKRTQAFPRVCPECCSPYYNRERTRPREDGSMGPVTLNALNEEGDA